MLITTIDDYARDRDLRSAIVDAVADRLRAVLLTTLTTVLGLAPLLYETSTQAQFLKPTVITLVYGLGFGMVLVLVVVPALLASGQDIARALQAARRALRGRAGRSMWPVRALAGGLALAGAATLGAQIVTGAMAVPGMVQIDGTAAAFGVFAAGALALTLATMLALTVVAGLRGRRASS